MSDPGRLTSHDKDIRSRHARHYPSDFVVACLGVFFWQAIIAAGML
jgi:hypothetical protein